MGIETARAVMSEKKQSGRQFIIDNMPHKVLAMFEDMGEIIEGQGKDLMSGQTVGVQARDVDILCLSAPCQPFSDLRGNRKKTTPEQHRQYRMQMFKCKQYLLRRRPFVVVQEQVLGRFTSAQDQQAMDTYLKTYVKSICDIRDSVTSEKVYAGVLMLTMNSNIWINMARPRCYMVFSQDKAMLVRTAQRIQAI